MSYADAVKKVQTRKPKENFMVIITSYSTKFVLPYKDGVAIMAALNSAEKLVEEYQKPSRIKPLEDESIRTYIMSGVEYERYKIAALLGVTIDEVKEHETKEAPMPF